MSFRARLLVALTLAAACRRTPRDEDPPARTPAAQPPAPRAATTTEVVPAAPPMLTLAPGVDLSGSWSTHSGPCNGRGAGDFVMDGHQRGTSFELRYVHGEMLCSIAGTACEGTWRGHSGSGWFLLQFTADGRRFVGTWGYGADHVTSGTITGERS